MNYHKWGLSSTIVMPIYYLIAPVVGHCVFEEYKSMVEMKFLCPLVYIIPEQLYSKVAYLY